MTRYAVLLAAALLAGCAGSIRSQAPIAPTAQSVVPPIQAVAHVQSRNVSPATCNRSVGLEFKPQGGAFHVPPCGGWTGTINYPAVGVRSRWSVTSSVTNNFGVPAPPSGTAIFYMDMFMSHPGAIEIPNGGVRDTVTSSAFTADHTYTLNVYNFAYNDQCPSSQCTWTMNIGSPQSGSHSITFVSPLNGATVIAGTAAGPVWQFVQN